MQLHHDPDWPRAAAWLAGEHLPGAKSRLGVLGVPQNKSISPGRCDLAPEAIRKALLKYSTWSGAVEIRDCVAKDFGDCPVAELSPEAAFSGIVERVTTALTESDAVVLLGGDNGVTRPGVYGLGLPLDRVGVITLDAHLDVRTTANGLHNGNPIRALIDDGLPGRNIVQIGIAPFANSKAYWDFAVSSGSHLVTVDQVWPDTIHEALETLNHLDGIYFDLDVDVLDRSLSPGTPGARPGGLSVEDAYRAALACGAHPKVRVMDLVEIDPLNDTNELSCLAAARFLLGFAAGLLAR